VAWMGAESGMYAVYYSPFAGGGWLAWPLAAIWHVCLLKVQKKWFADTWLAKFHMAGFWLFIWLAAHQSEWLLASVGGELASAGVLGADASTWPLLGWVLVPALSLLALQTQWVLQRWPLQEYRHAYLHAAAWPVALYLLVWAWISNFTSAGNAALFPYVPLFNPLELAHALVLGAVFVWWRALEPGTLGALPAPMGKSVAALTALVLLTGVVLRSCHHFADVHWTADALFASRLTQAALSITWALCGVLSMVVGHSKGLRAVWLAGAALLGVVVLKLFFVELADQGGLFRIVSFLSVGVLLLLVGYFAPVPPSMGGPAAKEAEAQDPAAQNPLPN
jgi:uncharacterized membrane protein